MFKFRPFNPTEEEYARVVAINNALWPDGLNSVDNLKCDDAVRDPGRFFQRLIIELDDPSIPNEGQET